MLKHWTSNTYVWFQSAGPAYRYAVLKDRFMPTKAIVVTMAVALLALNVADLVLTRIILGMGGIEANPLMVQVIESHWGIALKVGFVGFVALMLGVRKQSRKSAMMLAVVVGIYVGVVISNSMAYFRYLT